MTAIAQMRERRAAHHDRAATARYVVRIARDWQALAAPLVGRCIALTAFQDSRWLEAWYAAFAARPDIEPLIAIASDALTGDIAVVVPLIRRVQHGVRIVEFADLELTDYNAPLLGRAAPVDADGAKALWQALRFALRGKPGGADVVRLRKMPLAIGDTQNPLAWLDGVHRCPLNGNLIVTGDDYDAWRFTLERTVRKELERSWRVFTRDTGAAFEVVSDQDHAMRVLAVMERQQDARMRELGFSFILNDEACAAFYRGIVRGGLGSGYAALTSLRVGDEIIATLLGVVSGERCVMVRISNAGTRWSNCSPGRLIIERTMAALHARGVRQFDFSIGNYAYKRRFGVVPVPLVDLTEALGWRGWPLAVRDRAARWLRERPQLHDGLRRMLGRPPLHQVR